MAEIQLKQFKLTDEGDILFQPDPTNPLPGTSVGKIRKGAALLQPEAEATADTFDTPTLTTWLRAYLDDVLQPLAALADEEEIQQPARDVCGKLHEALGILPRSALEEVISGLDESGRAALRARKVRLGPVLVFLPLLNKPAAIRARALLWNLWHDKGLPADVPQDGVTSISVTEKADVDPVYYRAIGYPVYGPRAIRVDMLDRLVGAIYDSADKGVFKAKHEMAEWLGCTIPDLYAVLEAMDHKKIHDPADEQAAEQPAEDAPAAEEKPAEAAEETKSEEGAAPQPQVKPELATFKLRRGRAYGKPAQGMNKKTRDKKTAFKDNKKKRAPKKERQPRERERVISAAAKPKEENNPFAVLKGLKVQGKE